MVTGQQWTVALQVWLKLRALNNRQCTPHEFPTSGLKLVLGLLSVQVLYDCNLCKIIFNPAQDNKTSHLKNQKSHFLPGVKVENKPKMTARR